MQAPRGLRLASPIAALLALVCVLGPARPADAHGVGMSQLRLRVEGTRIEGEWELHVHDARLLVGLEPNATGAGAWEELRAREVALRRVLAGALALTADGRPCSTSVAPAPMRWDARQSVVALGLVTVCPVEPVRLGIRDDLLFDLDPNHRGYFSVEDARVTHVGVFHADLRSVTIRVHQFHPVAAIVEFAREGVVHIGSGLDHLLFLLALLLPAALVRARATWTPRPGLGATLREVTKVVTAFTVAHSVTLALAFFGVFRPPSQWVEVTIAFSVFVAAWNNLRPFLPGRAWVLAGGFGLVHGLGFAGALGNLSLPRHARGLALGSFNVGVELAQLAIVAVVLPLLYLASRHAWYPRLVMGVGSLAVAWMAAIWTLQRGLGLALFAGPGR